MGNIALGKTATASNFVMPYTAASAVNGTLTPFSRWLCNAVPGWLKIDTGAFSFVNRWVVRHMPVAGWTSPDYNICDFKLQGSNDNNTWADIDGVTSNTASVTDRSFSPVTFRYFRVYVTKGLRTNTQMASFMEFELYQASSTQLTNLAINSGTLTPAFNTNTYAYTATVTPDVVTINVIPTALSPTATIKVNNVPVTSGQPSPVALVFGSNTITVNITDGGVTQNYTIVVTRLASNYLSGLTAQAGTTNIPITPAFNKGTLGYTASVGYDVSSMTATPTAESTGATITVNGSTVVSGQASQAINLNVGSNTVTILVTAGGQSRTYTLTVTRSDSSYLSGLTAQSRSGAITLTPTFIKTTQSYNGSVANNISAVTITPTAENSAATITITGVNGTVTVVSGQASSSLALNEGNNTFSVAVTSSGTTFTYTVVIARAYNLLLTKINIAYMYRGGSGSTSVTTDATNLNYSVNLPNSPSTMTIAPFAASTNVVVKVNGVVVASGTPSASISVTSGMVVTITVSSPDNTQTRSYNLTVTK